MGQRNVFNCSVHIPEISLILKTVLDTACSYGSRDLGTGINGALLAFQSR